MNPANTVLMLLEARTRASYERYVARGIPPRGEAVAYHDADGLRFIVTYHPFRPRRYEFCSPEGGLRGQFDCRDSCLDALSKRMEVAR